MNIHKNARLTPLGRERLVGMIEGGASFAFAAQVCGCSAKTASKWWRRFSEEGLQGLSDRSSRPHVLRDPTAQPICERIIELRRRRLTGAHIAAKTGVSPATVSRVLRRAGLSRLNRHAAMNGITPAISFISISSASGGSNARATA